MTDSLSTHRAEPITDPHALGVDEVVAALAVDQESGLTSAEAASRLALYGPNRIEAARPPSAAAIILRQLVQGMTLMLIVIAVGGFLLGEVGLAVIISLLVIANVGLGTRQALASQRSVDALATSQVTRARVVRDGTLSELSVEDLVPGDIVRLEAGDIVPADGRLLASAGLEIQESALTGESVPVAKSAGATVEPDAALGDRATMAYQSTLVARGTATFAVTGTGLDTQIGHVSTMLDSISPAPSPLQNELQRLILVISIVAWVSVAALVGLGIARGLPIPSLILLGVSVAVSAIPSGLPTFVQALLAYGARLLAEQKAVVRNLSDVETLGATSAINTDKTGTLTLDEMVVTDLYLADSWYHVTGDGYAKTGQVLGVAGAPEADMASVAYALCLASDATVSDDGAVVGDPTEAAMVVLAAKLGIDAEATRRAYPRVAEVPFDSAYKFMATSHWVPIGGTPTLVEIVKGAPDVILDRCDRVLDASGSVTALGDARESYENANAELAGRGLRVIALAVRFFTPDDEAALVADPMAAVSQLAIVGLLGIVDPLRPEAVTAVAEAHSAGIRVRMITGDHAATARAIGAQLGLSAGAPGVITGPEFRALSDDDVLARIDDIDILGRAAPEDKLRLVQLMRQRGQIVAMTGDAVNDAAAIKAASIGVAMGSGSEVTKQAARMVLTDDNFGTLVHAVRLGRDIYDKIIGYVQYQMSQLVALLALFIVVSVLGIADGIALTPSMTLLVNFFIASLAVIMIMLELPAGSSMNRPPRNPLETITRPSQIGRWLLFGLLVTAGALVPLIAGPDVPDADSPTASMTMAFVVMGLSTAFAGFVFRQTRASAFAGPQLRAMALVAGSIVILLASTELALLRDQLMTVSLSPEQWLACIALALPMPIAVELDKAIARRRLL